MAEVFRAELVGAEGVTRELVVKKMHPTLALDPTAVAMFIEEARLAARLQHPNVVQVYEFGKDNDDYFLAMELVDGCDLATLLRTAAGPLPIALAGFIAAELLEGLGHVHALSDATGAPLGLVHRDVSPHNVLLRRNGEVKLADFGIAKAAARIGRETGQTGLGVKGKFAYMPPEQARGEALDGRADLFAVGAILYEMLTGTRVYAARGDGDLVDAVREGRVRSMAAVAPEVDAAFGGVVDRAVHPQRAARYESAAAMRQALLSTLDALGIRPSRSALVARVTAVLHADPIVPERPDRTLTAQDEVDPRGVAVVETPAPVRPQTATEPEGNVRALEPVAASPGPNRSLAPPDIAAGTGTSPRRRFLERVAIAVGVFTVAVLAERRTRPRPVAPPVPVVATVRPTVRVHWPRAMAPTAWLSPALLGAVEARCACRLATTAVSTDAELELLDAALLSQEVRADAVRRLDTFLAAVDAPGMVALQTALRDDARRLGAASGAAGEGTYLFPVVLDAVTLAVRDEAMGLLADAAPRAREALAALGAPCGAPMPAAEGFRADPAAWTSSDVAVAAAVWSRAASPWKLRVAWDGPSARVVAVSRAATFDLDGAHNEAPRAMAMAMGALGQWDVRLGVAGALEPMGTPWQPDSAAVVALGSEFARMASGAGSWRLHRLPRGDSLERDAAGEPRQTGSRAQSGVVHGYVLRRGATAAAGRLLLALSEAAPAAALAAYQLALPTRRDADPLPRVADGAVRARYQRVLEHDAAALAGGRFGAVSGVPAAEGDDAFVRVRDAVLASRNGICTP